MSAEGQAPANLPRRLVQSDQEQQSTGADTFCCADCPGIGQLWCRTQLARSILQHREPNANTVAMALRALAGESIEDLLRAEPRAGLFRKLYPWVRGS